MKKATKIKINTKSKRKKFFQMVTQHQIVANDIGKYASQIQSYFTLFQRK
jgi:hypothetical protein